MTSIFDTQPQLFTDAQASLYERRNKLPAGSVAHTYRQRMPRQAKKILQELFLDPPRLTYGGGLLWKFGEETQDVDDDKVQPEMNRLMDPAVFDREPVTVPEGFRQYTPAPDSSDPVMQR